MIRLGILGSTRGSNMEALVDAINQRDLSATIAVVVSNKVDAGILARAQSKKIATEFIDSKQLERSLFDLKISALLQKYQVDLVVLMGYMRILSKEFVMSWQNKIINVHPSLLPDFAGLMDLMVHASVLAADKKETGCTVHYVTEEVDAGPIIIQKKCPVFSTDTKETLKLRVQSLEGPALIEAIRLIG